MAGRKTGKYSQATRLLKLRDHLGGRRRGASVEELAARFGVSKRQIRRDVEALHDAGFAVVRELHGEQQRVVLQEGRPGAVHLTQRERYALLAIRRVFNLLPDTPFGEDVGSIFDKVSASLSSRQQGSLDELQDRFVYVPDGGHKPYDEYADVLDGLLTAVIYC